jgi:hypothetical protein
MPSFAVAFPDARLLLSLDPDLLAGLLLFHFRALPWRDESAVRRCVTHWVQPYPTVVRERLAESLFAAWKRLDAEGFLATETVASCRALPVEASPVHA